MHPQPHQQHRHHFILGQHRTWLPERTTVPSLLAPAVAIIPGSTPGRSTVVPRSQFLTTPSAPAAPLVPTDLCTTRYGSHGYTHLAKDDQEDGGRPIAIRRECSAPINIPSPATSHTHSSRYSSNFLAAVDEVVSSGSSSSSPTRKQRYHRRQSSPAALTPPLPGPFIEDMLDQLDLEMFVGDEWRFGSFPPDLDEAPMRTRKSSDWCNTESASSSSPTFPLPAPPLPLPPPPHHDATPAVGAKILYRPPPQQQRKGSRRRNISDGGNLITFGKPAASAQVYRAEPCRMETATIVSPRLPPPPPVKQSLRMTTTTTTTTTSTKKQQHPPFNRMAKKETHARGTSSSWSAELDELRDILAVVPSPTSSPRLSMNTKR